MINFVLGVLLIYAAYVLFKKTIGFLNRLLNEDGFDLRTLKKQFSEKINKLDTKLNKN